MSHIYTSNPYLQHFTAEITDILTIEDTYHIVLDQTAFYPGSPDMPCDTGNIEDCPITKTYLKEGIIYHISPKKPTKIHKVQCEIDFEKRLKHMQHSVATCLLSSLLKEQYTSQLISWSLGTSSCSMILSHPLSPADLESLFTEANTLIYQATPITLLSAQKQDIKKLKLKDLPKKVNYPLSLVQIGNLTPMMWDTLVPETTLPLMQCLYLKSEQTKSGFEVLFTTGRLAFDTIAHQHQTMQQQLAASQSAYNKLTSELQTLRSQVEDFEVQALLQQTLSEGDYKLITHTLHDKSIKTVQRFASKLVASDNVVALLGLVSDDMTYLVFTCSTNLKSLHMSRLLQDSITFIDGRGGGTATSAQGGGKSKNNLDSALLFAITKVKGQLNLS